MNCPFLRDSHVRTCHATPLRKLLADGGAGRAEEKCSSGLHSACAVFQAKGGPESGPCPYLGDAPVQYCGASAVAHYVPYGASETSRCGTDAHRFCAAYLSLARPTIPEVAHVPPRAWLAPNHLWLDESDDGLCHIGADFLLARMLGQLERITFLTVRGARRPSAVVTVCGVDWPLIFPNPLCIASVNASLRADCSRFAHDPYGTGWLFSGSAAPEDAAGIHRNLVRGESAAAWLAQEAARLSDWMQSRMNSRCDEAPSACDGGWIVEGAAHLLRRDELLEALNDFFAPHASWTKQP